MTKAFNIENLRANAPTLWAIMVATAIGVYAYFDIKRTVTELKANQFTQTDYGFVALMHNGSSEKTLPSLELVRSQQGRHEK